MFYHPGNGGLTSASISASNQSKQSLSFVQGKPKVDDARGKARLGSEQTGRELAEATKAANEIVESETMLEIQNGARHEAGREFRAGGETGSERYGPERFERDTTGRQTVLEIKNNTRHEAGREFRAGGATGSEYNGPERVERDTTGRQTVLEIKNSVKNEVGREFRAGGETGSERLEPEPVERDTTGRETVLEIKTSARNDTGRANTRKEPIEIKRTTRKTNESGRDERETTGREKVLEMKNSATHKTSREHDGGEQIGRDDRRGDAMATKHSIKEKTGREYGTGRKTGNDSSGREGTGRETILEIKNSARVGTRRGFSGEETGSGPVVREATGRETILEIKNSGRTGRGGETGRMTRVNALDHSISSSSEKDRAISETDTEVSQREPTGRMNKTAALDSSVSYSSEKDRDLSETDTEVNHQVTVNDVNFLHRPWSLSVSSGSMSPPPFPHSPEGNRKLTEVEVTSTQISSYDCDDEVFNSEVEGPFTLEERLVPVSSRAEENQMPFAQPSYIRNPRKEPEESSFSSDIRKQIASARLSFTALILDEPSEELPLPPPPLSQPPALPSSAPPPLPFSPLSSLTTASFVFNSNAAVDQTAEEVFSFIQHTNVHRAVEDMSPMWSMSPCPCRPTSAPHSTGLKCRENVVHYSFIFFSFSCC